MKQTYKNIVIALGLIGLVGCSTLEIAHDPLKCINRPLTKLSERMSADELNSMSDEVFDKFEIHILEHKERINSQCELTKRHNEAHK